MTRTIVMLATLLMLLAGCGSRTDVSSNVKNFDGVDPAMNAAIQKARDNVDPFIKALNAPQPGQEGFSVKMEFSDGEVIEHMWLAPIRYEAGTFHGVVNNEPESLTNVKIGQAASVPRGEISDRMYVQDGKIVGAETLRVIRNTLTAEERADFDKTFTFAD